MAMEVTSEILNSFEHINNDNELAKSNCVVSKVELKWPQLSDTDAAAQKDDDGDYIVRRFNSGTIYLEQKTSTRLQLVGLQLWRGALLLADLVIYLREKLRKQTVVELGAGVGLTSIVAAMFADRIVSTDIDAGGLLQLIERNVARNKSLLRGQVSVKPLDWLHLDWPSDVEKLIAEATVILAADVIYDDHLTEAFVRTVKKIMGLQGSRTLYIALEKRYVFTMADLDTVAPCYEHFLRCLKEEAGHKPWSNWKVEELPINFPQFLEYERVPQLVIWKISS